MAIAPIDLQTMYSQLQNVSKEVATREQGMKALEEKSQVETVTRNLENTKRVSGTEEQSELLTVNKDGRKRNGSKNRKRLKEKNADKEEEPKKYPKASYLGQHIDVTG